ncbi:hypothetical protein ACIPYQ_08925 [Streptomyces sp. NPDC090045]|uniref:hypothetical protein n=1 Tax=Streptomyces sp. NPDC090045 TaxID=3365927 RepID=UPI00381DA6FE
MLLSSRLSAFKQLVAFAVQSELLGGQRMKTPCEKCCIPDIEDSDCVQHYANQTTAELMNLNPRHPFLSS